MQRLHNGTCIWRHNAGCVRGFPDHVPWKASSRWITSGVKEVALQLAAIRGKLLALPDGPSPERYQLLKEQDALRLKASEFAVDADRDKSTEELEAELVSLKHRRKEIVDSRSGYAMGSGGSNQAATSGAWVKLSAQAHAASDLDRLTARISHLQDVLMDQEGDNG